MADITRIMDKDLEEINIINGKLQVEDGSSSADLGAIVSDVDNINTILTNAKDPLNSAIATMDIEHYEIHEGEHFFCSTFVAMTGSSTINWLVTTGAKRLHMTFSLNSADAGFSFITRENVAANADGTLQTLLNNVRESSTTSTATMRLNPTGINTTGSTVIRSGISGTGTNPSNRVSGSVNRGNEVIFKPNTKYLLTITNLSSATNNINIDHSWYEK